MMTGQMRTTIIATLLTLGLYFSGFLIFITPLPLIYLLLKRDQASVLPAILPSLLVVLLVYQFGVEAFWGWYRENPTMVWLFPVPLVELLEYFSPVAVKIMGATYFMVYVALAVGLNHIMRNQSQIFTKLFLLVVGIFVVVGLVSTAIIYPHSELLLADFRQYMAAGMEKFIQVQEQSGMDLEQVVYLKSKIGEYVQYSFFMLPFVYFMALVFLTVMNLAIAKRFFGMHFPQLEKIDLTRFKVPFGFVWFVIGVIVLMLLNEKFLHIEPMYYALLNVALCFGVVYFLQGFAVCVYFLNSKKIFGIFRFVFYFLLLTMMQTSVFVLAGLGFFENWLDVRKLDSIKKIM